MICPICKNSKMAKGFAALVFDNGIGNSVFLRDPTSYPSNWICDHYRHRRDTTIEVLFHLDAIPSE